LPEIAQVVESYGVIRIGGMEEPLDVFYRPHNFDSVQFDEAWSLAAPVPREEARVLSAIDLLASKADTDRQKALSDVAFLEGKIRSDFAPILRKCTADEARPIRGSRNLPGGAQ
jgi:hypothetical protein